MKKNSKKITVADYQASVVPTWCPGCGNFMIHAMLKQALVDLNIPPHQTVMTFDIGCASNGADKIKGYNVKVLHGRGILPAIGVKYTNPDLTVIANIGDGGMYWEGAAHWIASAQRNEDIVVLVANNQIYGLTTGQTSPTTDKDYATKTYPTGTVDEPINPIAVSLASGATFVARGWVGEPQHLKELIKRAINHKGFAIVDILQTCVTWNKLNTLEYYRNRVYKLEDKNHDTSDKLKAYKRAEELEKTPIGVFYEEKKPTIYEKYPMVTKKSGLSVKNKNINPLLNLF